MGFHAPRELVRGDAAPQEVRMDPLADARDLRHVAEHLHHAALGQRLQVLVVRATLEAQEQPLRRHLCGPAPDEALEAPVETGDRHEPLLRALPLNA